jgi:predicted metal-binding membrane protein
VRSTPHSIAALANHDRNIIVASVSAITLVAWAYLVHVSRQMNDDAMMAAMGMAVIRPWTAADISSSFTMWSIMMVGMMAASAAPVLLLFGAARAGRGDDRAGLSVLLFALGYIAVWAAFSAGAAIAQWGLHRTSLLSPAMAASSPLLGGAILIGAGVYQLTPWKGACLTRCRSPLGFLMTNWRDGFAGAFRMGVSHGASCLGCCWAVMCVLFVVGVMNLLWVAALSALVLVEKIGAAGFVVSRAVGVVMIAVGVAAIAMRV